MSRRLSRIQGRRAAASGVFGPQLLVSDSFNRANANALGNADTGQAWSNPGDTWGIATNQAQFQSGSGFAALIESGRGDVHVQANCFVGGVGDAMHVLARATDNNNLFFFGPTDVNRGHLGIVRRQSGSNTTLVTDNVTVMVDGDLLTLVCVGTALSGYLNGLLLVQTTSSFNQTATLVGLSTSSSTARADNFLATSP